MFSKSTNELDSVLQTAELSDFDSFINDNSEDILDDGLPFRAYLKTVLRRNYLTAKEMFENANIPAKYGYRLMAGRKHTTSRDIILRLCIGGQFTLEETQRALKLYEMSPLYSRVPRDAVIMIGINTGLSIQEIDQALLQRGLPAFDECGKE